MTQNKLSEIILRHSNPAGQLLAVLKDIQEEEGYLPEKMMKDLAQLSDTPLSKLYGLATFYAFFNLKPVGKNIITVCMGTACHVKGAPHLLSKAAELLKVNPEETSENGKFMLTTEMDCSCSLTTARCFGTCSMAPVLRVNNKIYGNVTAKKLPQILKEYGWRAQ